MFWSIFQHYITNFELRFGKLFEAQILHGMPGVWRHAGHKKHAGWIAFTLRMTDKRDLSFDLIGFLL